MRKINKIIVHCADTPARMDIGVAEIRQWHLDKGWSDIGYAFVIRRDGTIETGRDLNNDDNVLDDIGAHVAGHNADSVGICLVGGKGLFNFTRSQLTALEVLLRDLTQQIPGATVSGHRDFDSGKQCPQFDVGAWWYD